MRTALHLTATAGLLAAAFAPTTAQAAPPPPVQLRQAVHLLTVAPEVEEGYKRTLFHHWTDSDHDGCDTRQEALKAEATGPIVVGKDCKILSGTWYSYYDDTTVHGDPAHQLDLDHLVPLKEAFNSGADTWTPERREAYANDLGVDTSLVMVTAHSNRAKSDKDPAQWMPPYEPAACRYITEWTATKLRWGLAVDQAEADTLTDYAEDCPNVPLDAVSAPNHT
ncbi:HNH endonuclease family protein [Streptomyces sp. NBC_01304]|uniref:HNH endonuclease family protein n=1 Tax=Streptomyces sp. NBC_01304 TaxID=2903818 RepID=UPI002E113D3B|nr:HNH endonuclease family protein [Streptomyces sp. NBC_01304]